MRCPKTPSPAETLRPGSSRMCSRMPLGAGVCRGLWTIRGQDLGLSLLVSPRVSGIAISRRPATPQGAEAAPDRSAVPLAARSPLVGTSTTATDPAGAAPGRRGGAARGTAGTDLADTPRRPPPAHRTVRSTDAPPAPYEPGGSCPAPTAPSPAQASAPDPATAHSRDNGTAHRPAAAVPSLKAPYREGRQSDSPGVGREPDGTTGAAVPQWGQKRRGRCSQQPKTDDTRPRHGEAPSPCGLGADGSRTCHSYSRNSSSILRLTTSCRPSMHFAYRLSKTSTLLPARAATSVGSTPALSQVDNAECRRS
ncbi:hypothetical protein KE639_04986 [Streptomyces sp. V17-9]|nr:hypothetical protein KE639_04986 [Streptomyces sp. V17-9]